MLHVPINPNKSIDNIIKPKAFDDRRIKMYQFSRPKKPVFLPEPGEKVQKKGFCANELIKIKS